MKRGSFIYFLLMPYVIIGTFVLSLKLSNAEVSKPIVITIFILLLLLGLVGIGLCVLYNIASVAYDKPAVLARRNLILKLCHIPIHLLMILCTLSALNPFLFLLSWVPLVCGISVLVFDGCVNIGACLSLVVRKKAKLSHGVLLCAGSFIHIVDIACSIVQIIISKDTIARVQAADEVSV